MIKRRGLRQKKPLEVVAFELMMERRPHIYLLLEHRKTILRGVFPFFLGEGRIEETSNNLFALKSSKTGKQFQRSLSQHMTSLPLFLQYNYTLADGGEVSLKYESVPVIDDVLRLYYGTKFVILHGVSTNMISKDFLSNFPSERNLQGGLSRLKAAEN